MVSIDNYVFLCSFEIFDIIYVNVFLMEVKVYLVNNNHMVSFTNLVFVNYVDYIGNLVEKINLYPILDNFNYSIYVVQVYSYVNKDIIFKKVNIVDFFETFDFDHFVVNYFNLNYEIFVQVIDKRKKNLLQDYPIIYNNFSIDYF